MWYSDNYNFKTSLEFRIEAKTHLSPGADPGIFVRGGGGSNLPKILKKKNEKKEREGAFSYYSALEWSKSIFAMH